jgi:sulfoxide reductase heme-binding subunit YedZ
MTGPDPTHQLWWLAARSAGVVALLLVTLSVGLGLAMAAGLLRGPGRTKVMVSLHEQLALCGLVAIALHGIALLGDAFLHPGLDGVLIPFVLDYRPAYTAAGILAAYLAAALGLSFYARRRFGAKRWRSAHRATTLVYALAVVHTLGAGTDAGAPWLRLFVLGSLGVMAALVARRVARPRGRPRGVAANPAAVRSGDTVAQP